jgi:hypothetical protein
MKNIIIVFSVLLTGSFFIYGYSETHLNRNKYNILPSGILKIDKDGAYRDEDSLVWEMQPQIKNKFHQPDNEVLPIKDPYPNVKPPPEFDSNEPNWKFLSQCKDSNGSFEAILQPDGSYLTTGKKQGTYNYGHPSPFLGVLIHTFLDVIPHFVNGNYKTPEINNHK